MSSEARTILKHGSVYFVGNVVHRAGGLLLLPLYAKVLPPEDFGIYALIVVACDLLSVGLTSGINNALTLVYFQFPDQAMRRRVVGTSVLTLSTMALVLIALAHPLGHGVGPVLLGDTAFGAAVAWAIAGIACSALFEFSLSYYRIRKRPGVFVLAALAKSVLLVGFSAVLLLVLEYGVPGIFIGNTLSFAVLSAVLLGVIVKENGLRFHAAILRGLVRSGLPFVPTSLLDVGSAFSERYLLGLLQSTGAVGVYAFGARMSQLLYMFVINPFAQIWWVRRMETAREATDRTGSALAFRVFAILLSAAALGLSLLTPELLWLLATPAYGSAVFCTPFLALAMVLQGIRLHPEASLVGNGRAVTLPVLSAASLAAGAALTAVLVWRFGLVGAAMAHLGRQAFHLAGTELLCRRFCPEDQRLPVLRLVWLIALAIGAYALWWGMVGMADVSEGVGPITVAAKIVLVTAFLAGVFISPALGPDGRAMVLSGLPLPSTSKTGPVRR